MKSLALTLALMLTAFLAVAQTDKQPPTRKALEPSEELTVFPHITSGNGWKTKFVLFNVSNVPIAYRMVFYDNEGQQADAMIKDEGSVSELFDTLQPYGSVRFETEDNDSSEETQFWAALEEGSGAITGLQTFEWTGPDGRVTSATVPISDDFTVDPIIVPFDNTNGGMTALVITNTDNLTSPEAHTIIIQGADESGNLISETQMTIESGDKPAFLVAEEFPALANQKGVLFLDAEDIDVGFFAVLALQFDDNGNVSAILPFEGVFF